MSISHASAATTRPTTMSLQSKAREAQADAGTEQYQQQRRRRQQQQSSSSSSWKIAIGAVLSVLLHVTVQNARISFQAIPSSSPTILQNYHDFGSFGSSRHLVVETNDEMKESSSSSTMMSTTTTTAAATAAAVQAMNDNAAEKSNDNTSTGTATTTTSIDNITTTTTAKTTTTTTSATKARTTTSTTKSSSSSSSNTTTTTSNHQHLKRVPKFQKEILDRTKPWDDSTTWTFVQPSVYKDLVQSAKEELQYQLHNFVDTNCKLHIVPVSTPPPTTTLTDVVGPPDDSVQRSSQSSSSSSSFKAEELSSPSVKFQFECGGGGGGDDTDLQPLQDEPCHNATSGIANVCLVVTDHNNRKPPPTTSDNNRSNNNKNNSNNYNHNYSNNKSALLMMVDSMEYLWKSPAAATKDEATNFTYWKSFLNKATYAHTTQRPMFVWIGHIPPNELHSRRNNRNVYDKLHAPCQPRESTNKMHYYKPLLMEAVLGSGNGDGSHSGNDNENDNNDDDHHHRNRRRGYQRFVPNITSVFFLDADNSFSDEAFRPRKRIRNRITTTTTTTTTNHNRCDDDDNTDNTDYHLIGPEDYLALSPQASIFGSQNTNGGILMNGGLLILRNTPITHDFLSLWFYFRCGHKDQRGLWMVLLTIWSVMTYGDHDDHHHFGGDAGSVVTESGAGIGGTTATRQQQQSQFGFPGIIFLNYNYANSITLTHVRRHAFQIQDRWNELLTTNTSLSSSSSSSLWCSKNLETSVDEMDTALDCLNGGGRLRLPTPFNTTLYDGGKFVRKGYLTAPLELPHVLLLPLTTWHQPTQATAINANINCTDTTTTTGNRSIDDNIRDLKHKIIAAMPTASSKTATTAMTTTTMTMMLNNLPGFKAEIYDDEKEPFVIHKKRYNGVCTNGKCLPWLQEEEQEEHEKRQEEQERSLHGK